MGSVAVWSKTGEQELALRAACDVLAATVTRGRAGFLHRVRAAWINRGLNAAIKDLNADARGRVAQLLKSHWPKVLHDPEDTFGRSTSRVMCERLCQGLGCR